MAAQRYFVGLDVGGTTMKAAVVDDSGKPLSEPAVLDTHPELGQDAGLETMCEAIRPAVAAAKLKLKDIAAIGVATPGLMDIKAGLILDPPNLKPWKNVPVRDHIKKAFGKPTAYQNDANAAAYGEFWVGAAQDAQSMVLFTLGTGVGGGIILDDVIVEGEHSHGGGARPPADRPAQPRPAVRLRRPRLPRGLRQRHQRRRAGPARRWPPGASRRKLRDYFTANDDEFTAKVIFDLADAGDELALKVVDDTAYYLAARRVRRDRGGGPGDDRLRRRHGRVGRALPAQIEAYVKRFGLPFPAKSVQIALAKLGSDAGFIGAAGCARMLVGKK